VSRSALSGNRIEPGIITTFGTLIDGIEHGIDVGTGKSLFGTAHRSSRWNN